MLRKMFNWFGKSDEEFMKEPRRVPESVKDIPDGDDRWIMTREFALESKVNHRYYLAARKYAGEEDWVIVQISSNLKYEAVIYSESERALAKTPRQVMNYLTAFERHMRSSARNFIPVASSWPTYIKFANRHGLHFNDKGQLIDVSPDAPVIENTVLPRDSLDKLFNPESLQIPPLSTWEGVYARIVDKLPENGVAIVDLVNDKAFYFYAQSAREMMAKLNALAENLQSDKYTMPDKEKALLNMADYVIANPLNFDSDAKARTARYLCDTTILIGLLRAGSDVYRKQFENGEEISPRMLQLVKRVSETITFIASQRLSIPSEEAKRIGDIIGQGPDPFGQELPLEKILKVPESKAVQPPFDSPGNTPFF